MTTPDAPAFRNLSTEALTEPFDLVLDLRVALRRLGRKFPMDEQSTTAQTAAAAALLAALGVDTADQAGHVTTIEGPDAAGHWEWRCTRPGCHTDAGGYDQAADVIAAATAHGPLAADSLMPTDDAADQPDQAPADDLARVLDRARRILDTLADIGPDRREAAGLAALLAPIQHLADAAARVGSDRSQTREGPAVPGRVVAASCPSCGETFYPERPGSGERCRGCRYYDRPAEPADVEREHPGRLSVETVDRIADDAMRRARDVLDVERERAGEG